MTEDEFHVLLKIKGQRLVVTQLTEESPYYIGMIIDTKTLQPVMYAAGKTYKATIKETIKRYYADT